MSLKKLTIMMKQITNKIGTGDQAKEFLFSSLQKLYLYNIFRYNQKLQLYLFVF